MKRRFTIERIPGPLASLYEKATRLVIEIYYRQVAEEVISFLKEGLILDLGTGPGYLPIELVKKAPGVRVCGIDLSRSLIRKARTNARNAGVETRVHFEVGNASRLRFPEASFDMVVSTGMLHVLRDPVKAIGECWRVLKPGHEAWIYDPARVSSQVDAAKWKASLNSFERHMYRLLPLFARVNPPHSYTREQVEEWIRRTPFRHYAIQEQGIEIKIRLRKQSGELGEQI